MSEYVPTIGLEIHAELKTATKMFCNSKNDPNETRANVNVCPVCMAHPGTLPVINREAVRHVLRVGTALRGTLADYTEFDRKNYFYPDLPKGYQLSQYEYPLVSGGELCGVKITRVHLEEDTASSTHDEVGGATLIDYNRAGVPLMELVTDPVITSSRQAGDFARELQLLLRYLGASDANMEKGEMRVEANVSVGRDGILGTKVEIKNLNSFKAMERAVEYEIKRQAELLNRGDAVLQETRGWDEGKQSTFAQRSKEGSADYRYFPDPDLPSLRNSEIEGFTEEQLRAGMPELPSNRRARYMDLGLKADDADMFVRQPGLGALFDHVTEGLGKGDTKLAMAGNLVANNIAGDPTYTGSRDINARDTDFKADMPMKPEHLVELIDLISAGKISSNAAKQILSLSLASGTAPDAIAKEKNLYKVEDEAGLEQIVDRILTEHTSVVQDVKSGKTAALQFLVGQAMKATRGAADPVALRTLIEKKVA